MPGPSLGQLRVPGTPRRPRALRPARSTPPPGDDPLAGQQHPRQAESTTLPANPGDQPGPTVQGVAAVHPVPGGLLEGPGRQPDTRPGHDLGQRVQPRHQSAGRPGPDPHGVQRHRAVRLGAPEPGHQPDSGPQLGFLGTSYINVLQLNEALAKLEEVKARPPSRRWCSARATRCAGRSSRWCPSNGRRSGPMPCSRTGRGRSCCASSAVPRCRASLGRNVVAQGTPGLARGAVVMVNPLYSFAQRSERRGRAGSRCRTRS